MGDSANVNLTINQTEQGGTVYAHAYDSVCADVNFNLTYEDETADKIYLGYLDGTDTFQPDFEGSFNLALNMADADITSGAVLQDTMLEIWGFDSNFGEDTLSFDFTGISSDYGSFEDWGSYADFGSLKADADVALDGNTDYFFGTVGGDGYLAYDQDGDGITLMIEFHDMTSFNGWSIDNYNFV
jgi:hypothetical protein